MDRILAGAHRLVEQRFERAVERRRLHRARVPGRQGVALVEGLAERMQAAKKLRRLDEDALRLGLKGDKKHEFLCAGLGWDARTSPKRISRLRAEFKDLRSEETAG